MNVFWWAILLAIGIIMTTLITQAQAFFRSAIANGPHGIAVRGMRGSRHIPGGTARRAKGPASAVDPSSSKSSEASRGKKPTKSKIVFTEGESLSQERLIAFMESLSQKTDGSRGKRTGGVLRTICVENRQRVAVEKKPATPAAEVPLAPSESSFRSKLHQTASRTYPPMSICPQSPSKTHNAALPSTWLVYKKI